MKTLLLALVFAALANAQSLPSGNAIRLRGRPIAATAPTDTQTLCWDAAGPTWKPCTGTSNMLLTSGASDPSGACAAGTSIYLQTTTQDFWGCVVSGTWKKFLSTLNTGTYASLGLSGAQPATPAAGFINCWYDSTAKTQKCVDDAGALTKMSNGAASVNLAINGGGSAITAGTRACGTAPYAGTITGYSIVANASGAIVFDVWKTAFGAALPTIANTIVASTPPTLSSAVTVTSTTLTGWTTAIALNDLICVNVASASTVTSATLQLKVTR